MEHAVDDEGNGRGQPGEGISDVALTFSTHGSPSAIHSKLGGKVQDQSELLPKRKKFPRNETVTEV